MSGHTHDNISSLAKHALLATSDRAARTRRSLKPPYLLQRNHAAKSWYRTFSPVHSQTFLFSCRSTIGSRHLSDQQELELSGEFANPSLAEYVKGKEFWLPQGSLPVNKTTELELLG